MKLGILSDNHGRIEPLREAMRCFKEAGAGALVHCGDVGGLDVLDELVGWRCWFVWGNTDSPPPGWERYVESLGLPCPRVPVEFTLDKRRFAVCHGHEREFYRVRDQGEYDYVLFGHTHAWTDFRIGPTRVINPGALHRASVRTVALLDVQRDRLDRIEIDRAGAW